MLKSTASFQDTSCTDPALADTILHAGEQPVFTQKVLGLPIAEQYYAASLGGRAIYCNNFGYSLLHQIRKKVFKQLSKPKRRHVYG